MGVNGHFALQKFSAMHGSNGARAAVAVMLGLERHSGI
jgi:hypothetical protein